MSAELILQNDVQGVDDARNVTENGQEDVDEEICEGISFCELKQSWWGLRTSIAATFQEDTERWEDDGEDDLDDVATGEVSTSIQRAVKLNHLPSGERHDECSCFGA